MTKDEMMKRYGYELKNWMDKLMSPPVEEIRIEDYSMDYQVDQAHLWRLENGKYAVIYEIGCSCYMIDDADILIFENENDANADIMLWVAGH